MVSYFTSKMDRLFTIRQQFNNMSMTVGNDSNIITINGLDKNFAYSLQVSANTVAGRGALSMPFPVPLHGKKANINV